MAFMSTSFVHVMVLLVILEIFNFGGSLAVKIASLSSSLGNEHPYNPCKFNPTCLCSTGAAEYGSVVCDGVPMADIPTELQDSRVFKLHLRSNGLTRFPDSKLEGTGLWKLEVSHNDVSEIPSMAFYGLERALWELHLSHNKLIRVPADSIALLKKLSVLNLADNFISELRKEDLQTLATSLKTLDLSGNSLTSVPEGIFWDLQRLETLDLSRNNIIQIHSMAFQNGVIQLSHLNLADNLMGKIPFVPLSHVKSLKSLDMSNNRIIKIEDSFFASGTVRLDRLLLKENALLGGYSNNGEGSDIDVHGKKYRGLPSKSFTNFDRINYTSLEGSPIRSIGAAAFSESQIRHLDLSHCQVDEIDPLAFRGLEKSLESIDLSANRLRKLPLGLFEDFDLVRKLKLNDNMLSISPNISFNGFRYTIKDLDLHGTEMAYVPFEEFGIMRNLRTVGIAKTRGKIMNMQEPSKEPDLSGSNVVKRITFKEFAPGLEHLDLVNSGIREIDKDAFLHIPSVSHMDLSNNKIQRIDDEAFQQVGNALHYLRISNSLYFTKLPNAAFQSLTALKILDLSDNHIQTIPLDTFHKMSQLTHLYLQDNKISTFKTGTFHSQANPHLCILDLSFNRIKEIPYDTFRFPNLERLLLDDNRISKLDSRSFVEMTNLKYLSLEGNVIKGIPDEAFQNLHHLSTLNLAYNNLEVLNFAAFDSVGTLSHLLIDVSHNKLNTLRVNRTAKGGKNNGTQAYHGMSSSSRSHNYPTSSNIVSLNLAYNNISMIEQSFFQTVETVLKILNISNNRLSEVTPQTLGHLKRLHIIDLSHNLLKSIGPATFLTSRKLQSIHLNSNYLTSVPSSLFSNHRTLKLVDVSNNLLESLPEQLFQRTSLGIFRGSYNKLTEIPVKTLNPVQSTLKHLDLSGNRISTISDSQLNQIQYLVVLNLAGNRITTIDEAAFCCLPNLLNLDLSNNPLKTFDPNTFNGVRNHLQILNMANTSQTLLPALQLPRLKEFNVSANHLTFVPPNTLSNLSEVRVLDLSSNELPAPPSNAWHSMHHLRVLNMGGNPITKVLNSSFLGLDRLESLDISNIQAEMYQSGSFGMMSNLRKLRLDVDGRVGQDLEDGELGVLELATLLRFNPALESLAIRLVGAGLGSVWHGRSHGSRSQSKKREGQALRYELQNTPLPPKLRSIVLEGENIENIYPAALKHLRSRRLHLTIRATGQAKLERDLFLNLGRVQNLSLNIETIRPTQSLHSGQTKKANKRSVLENIFSNPPHSLGNPVTTYFPGHPRAVFLQNLKIGGSSWRCNCDGIGWTEKWLRRWRGIFCGHGAQTSPGGLSQITGICRNAVRDLRSAYCASDGYSTQRNPESVLHAIRERLDCDIAYNSALISVSLSIKRTLTWMIILASVCFSSFLNNL